MANKRITELNLHTSLELSDSIAIVNNNQTKKTTYGSLYYDIRDGLVSGSEQIILGDVTNFTSYSSSVESKLTNLINATSSYLTSETDSQTLSIVGDQLTISNGNTITIPTGSGGVSTDISALNTFTSSQESLNISLENDINTLYDSTNNLNTFTSSQELLNTTFATTGSNTFEGNQQINGWLDATDYIATDNVLYTNFIEENTTNGGLTFVAGGSGFSFNNNVEFAGSVTANDFTGSLFGTASVSNQLLVSQSTTNSNFKLLFATTGDGNKDVLQDSGTDGTYNPWTNTLTAANLSGTATNATNVNIATNSTNTNYYVSFAYGAGNNRVSIDGGGQFTYNPSTNTLTVPTVVGDLTGTATNATTASHALDAMITGSLSDGTLTFTKGDSSTFDIDLEAVFTKHAWISCYSTSSQALVSSGSAQPVTFTSIWTESGVSLVSGSQITFAEAGTYEFNFVAQVQNSDNAVHECYFWIKYNGNNFPNSTTQITLPTRKDSGDASAQLMTMSIIGVAQNNNDYIELYWTGESTELSLAETPAFNGIPETPSVIASIKRIG